MQGEEAPSGVGDGYAPDRLPAAAPPEQTVQSVPDTTRVCLDISCNVVSPLLCAISLSSRSHLTATCSYWDVSDQCLCMSSELPASLDFSLVCSYIVRANEKQAVFTGKEQRDGVAILAFIVAGLFGPVGHEDAGGAFAAEHEAERMAAAASTNATGYEADGDNEAAKIGRNFVIDWAAYHNVWGDTPVDVAVTEMLAEYAVLYSRIAGRTTSAVPPPMTISEGLDIDEQAQNFVNKFVTPFLGHIASVKVHKLLCHVTDAIRWHGNLQNGNTAVKKSEHKSDKPFCARTSQNAHTFTRQNVRHADGSRAILARHAKADEIAAATWKAELARRAAVASAAVTGVAAGPLGSGAAAAAGWLATVPIEAPTAGRAAVMCPTAEEERRRKQQKRMYNASKVTVRQLASRLDLANVGVLLKMAAHRQGKVPTRTPIQAQFDYGTRMQQQLRAVENVLGAPWYDAVLYRP